MSHRLVTKTYGDEMKVFPSHSELYHFHSTEDFDSFGTGTFGGEVVWAPQLM